MDNSESKFSESEERIQSESNLHDEFHHNVMETDMVHESGMD